MEKNTGKVREKSGNFVIPEKWEPWLIYNVKHLTSRFGKCLALVGICSRYRVQFPCVSHLNLTTVAKYIKVQQ